MRDTIIIHCSATRAGQDFTAADIDRWHRQRGFRSIGYHFVVRLDNESRLLHSGASGTVVVPSIYKDCIAIPQTATVRMQDKTIVYKVVDGKAVSTLITVAANNDGREYVVLDGLKAGDEIVSEGAGLVREGMQVK